MRVRVFLVVCVRAIYGWKNVPTVSGAHTRTQTHAQIHTCILLQKRALTDNKYAERDAHTHTQRGRRYTRKARGRRRKTHHFRLRLGPQTRMPVPHASLSRTRSAAPPILPSFSTAWKRRAAHQWSWWSQARNPQGLRACGCMCVCLCVCVCVCVSVHSSRCAHFAPPSTPRSFSTA